eukprot:6547931-Alexandrium_andersonii.AAC.1
MDVVALLLVGRCGPDVTIADAFLALAAWGPDSTRLLDGEGPLLDILALLSARTPRPRQHTLFS